MESTPNSTLPKFTSREISRPRELNLAVIVTILLQTGAGLWWAATTSAKVDSLLYQATQIQAERYTKTDAIRDREFVLARLAEIERRISSEELELKEIKNARR